MKKCVKIVNLVIVVFVLLSLLVVSTFASDDHKHELDNGYFYSGNCIDGFQIAFECLDCDYVTYVSNRLFQHDLQDGVCLRCGYSELSSELHQPVETTFEVFEEADPEETTQGSSDFVKNESSNSVGMIVFVLAVVLGGVFIVYYFIKRGMKK